MRRKKLMLSLALSLLFSAISFGGITNAAENGKVYLFTPYTNVSIPPGESINHSIEAVNNSDSVQNFELSLDIPSDKWKVDLTSGGNKVHEVSVKPEDSLRMSLQIEVPLEIEKGTYTITLKAKGMDPLTLTIDVSEKGTYNTEFEVSQPNMEGSADATFNYSVSLKNRTLDKQLYALKADAPQGWDVQYSVGGKNVTSVNIEPNTSESINITLDPPDQIKEGSYKIPIHAVGDGTQSDTELEAVITGSYGLSLSTASGLLSSSVTAGKTRKIDLTVTNSGTAEMRDIELNSTAPINWEVTFEPQKIQKLAAGQTTTVQATIKADSKAIAGDYVVQMSARSPEKTSSAQFRIAVKASVLWGWLGIIFILLVLGLIYYLFRKYGRR